MPPCGTDTHAYLTVILCFQQTSMVFLGRNPRHIMLRDSLKGVFIDGNVQD
jgi:hypothetical protein